jgi:hypothetical protein
VEQRAANESVATHIARDPAILSLSLFIFIVLRSNQHRDEEGEGGWATLGVIGSNLSNQGPFDSRNYGFGKLSDLFTSIDLFEMKQTKNGPITTYWVRIKKRPTGGPSAGG